MEDSIREVCGHYAFRGDALREALLYCYPKSEVKEESLSKTEDKLRISSMEEPKAILHEFARQSKASSDMIEP